MTETIAPGNLTPPPGFRYNPNSMSDYAEQVQTAVDFWNHQNASLPNFEGVQELPITPSFNPTHAPDTEIYARNRMPYSTKSGKKIHSQWPESDEPVTMWRVVEREKLKDGTGITASQVLQTNSLGDVEGIDDTDHYKSHHEQRLKDMSAGTPFVSFSTDPVDLAGNLILRKGFGVKGGRDSVVIQVRVDPGRVLTGPNRKEPEVLLLGGVGPTEYVAAYRVSDFVAHAVPEGEVTTMHGDTMHRDKVLGHWALRS